MSKGKKGLSRRTMLRGLLGGASVAVGLPALEVFLDNHGKAYADGSAFPQRFGVFFWGNGVLPWNWVPEQAGPDYVMSEQLLPLERHRDIMTIISGTDVKTGGRFPHNSAIAGMLTGAPIRADGEEEVWQAPTIDQLIAEQVGSATAFRSLQTSGNGGTFSVSHTGPRSRVPSEPSPHALFQTLFVENFREPGDDPTVDPTLSLRRSVLDAVLEQNRTLQRRLGRADIIRLDQHFTHVRELEQRVARLELDPPSFAACMLPMEPPAEIPDDERGRTPVGLRNELMAELLAMSLACDQTRVFSHMLSRPVGDLVYPVDGLELPGGIIKGHHDLTHNEPDEPGRETMWRVNEIVKYITAQLAVFVDKLRAIEEGDGTLLDSMALLSTTDSSNPRLHSLEDFPILIFGNLCGQLVSGTHLTSDGGNAAEVALTLIRAMGIPLESWGMEGGFTTSGFSELEL